MHFREAVPKRNLRETSVSDVAAPYSGTMESAWNLWNEMFGEEEQQARDAWEREQKSGRKQRADVEDLWEDGYGAYAEDGEEDLMESYYRFSRSMRSGKR